ncbi:hypothetical protein E2C01_099840 [Portunus trituberculatus]|uniref:Uncharacterized protein n=1 Tax=Portunus trituberculatus TaxID=210409 RepID=A0A5B7KFW3_PORTR|nr:hypothetical protein [Portunus trituberculatus]
MLQDVCRSRYTAILTSREESLDLWCVMAHEGRVPSHCDEAEAEMLWGLEEYGAYQTCCSNPWPFVFLIDSTPRLVSRLQLDMEVAE